MREDDPQWYKDAVFYEVYVRGFFDADGDGNGDLRGLTEKLDYLRDLGIDCLWLMPILPTTIPPCGARFSTSCRSGSTTGSTAFAWMRSRTCTSAKAPRVRTCPRRTRSARRCASSSKAVTRGRSCSPRPTNGPMIS